MSLVLRSVSSYILFREVGQTLPRRSLIYCDHFIQFVQAQFSSWEQLIRRSAFMNTTTKTNRKVSNPILLAISKTAASEKRNVMLFKQQGVVQSVRLIFI